jgi:hypothetical protein
MLPDAIVHGPTHRYRAAVMRRFAFCVASSADFHLGVGAHYFSRVYATEPAQIGDRTIRFVG